MSRERKRKSSSLRMTRGCAWLLAVVLLFSGIFTSLGSVWGAEGDTFDINRSISRRFTGESLVLLRNNDDVFPLTNNDQVAVFGSTQVNTQMTVFGSGSTVGIGIGFVDTLSAMKNEGIQVDSILEGLYRRFASTNPPDTGMYNVDNEILSQRSIPEMPLDDDIVSQAAVRNDKAVIFIGRTNGEGYDWNLEDEYKLRAEEREMIELVTKHFDQVSVILNTASPIDMTWDSDKIDAILWVGIVGAQGANAIADVLSGKVNPSGKLTQTWVEKYEDTPTHMNYEMTNWPEEILGPELMYEEDIYVGYRYYDTFNVEPKFHFGYGLSYSDFETVIDNVSADASTVTVTATVKNTGEVAGKEVVQVYYSAPDGKLEKAYQNLAGFAKTDLLEPGDKQTLTITYRTRDMASYDEEFARYILEEGEYVVRVGNSSRSTQVGAVIDLDSLAVTEQLSNQMTEALRIDRFTKEGVEPYTYSGEQQEIANADRIILRASDIITEDNTSTITDEPELLEDSIEAQFVQMAQEELAVQQTMMASAAFSDPSDSAKQLPGKVYCNDLGINFAGFVRNDPSGDVDGYISITVENANTQMPFDVNSAYPGRHSLTLRYYAEESGSVSVLNQKDETICTFELNQLNQWADAVVQDVDLTGVTEMKLLTHQDNMNLNWLDVKSQEYPGLVEATLEQGSYGEAFTVGLYNTYDPDADIYYTLDGSEPGTTSERYEEPFVITENMTVTAVAVKEGLNIGKAVSYTYTLDESIASKAVRPSVSYAGKDEQDNQRLVLRAEKGMSIFYTTDGSNPVFSSNYYSGPISVPNGTTVKAVAVGPGFIYSDIAEVNISAVDMPQAGLETLGTYEINQAVSLTAGTGAEIYYTISRDGTDPADPTAASAQYTEPIVFDTEGQTVIKAIAIDKNGTSDVSVFVYKIVEKLLTLEDVFRGEATVEQVVAQMTITELAEVAANSGRSARFLSPHVSYADGPLGVKTNNFTQWAAPSLLACSWDVDLFAEQGNAVGKEMVETNIDFWLAPGINILRDPRSGRNPEYYAEDETLTGILSSSVIRNVQEHGVGCVIKHYVGNDQETNRKQNANAVVSERALREIYLKAFEIAVRTSQPWALMTTYCDVNRISTATNFALCTAIPRGEWGFEGIIMTDWSCYADNGMMMYAGNDMVMPSGSVDVIKNAVLNPENVNTNDPNYTKPLTKAMMQRNIAAIFDLMVKTNAFARSIGEKQVHQYQAPGIKWLDIEKDPVTATVSASAGANGTVTPASQEVVLGADARFTLSIDDKYTIGDVVTQPRTEYVLEGSLLTLKNIKAETTVDITFRLIPEGPDFEELRSIINKAEKLLDEVQIGGKPGQYLQSSAEKLNKAIETAKTYANNSSASVLEIEEAIANLKQAVAAFEGSALTITTHRIVAGEINKVLAIEHSDASPVINSEACSDQGGGRNTTGTYKGTYLEYTLDVADSNLYSLCGRISTNEDECGFEVYVDGELQGTIVQQTRTGGWQNWATSDPLKVQLDKGAHKIKIIFIKNGINLNYLTLEPLMKSISAESTGNGTVSPESAQVEMGAEFTFELQPDDGYMPNAVKITPDTDFVLYRNKLTIKRVMSDIKVSVDFKKIPDEPDLNRLNQLIATSLVAAEEAKTDGKAGNFTPSLVRALLESIEEAKDVANNPQSASIDVEYAIIDLEQAVAVFQNSRLTSDIHIIPAEGTYRIKATSHNETSSGIGSEGCEDEDGGRNPIYTDGGTWLSYTFEAEKEGWYEFTPRVSVYTTGAGFHVLIDEEEAASYTKLQATGGWQNWVTQETTLIKLPAGIHKLKILFAADGMNVNWFELTAADIAEPLEIEELRKAIEEADAVKDKVLPTSVRETFDQAYNHAVEVYILAESLANLTAQDIGQNTVDQAAAALKEITAEAAALPKRNILQYWINSAAAAKDSEEYQAAVPTVQEAFDQAYKIAKEVFDKVGAVQEEIYDVAWALMDQIHALGIFRGDKEELQSLVDYYNSNAFDLGKYEDGIEKDGFKEALKKAEAVLANEDATDDVIAEALTNLQEAALALIPKEDKELDYDELQEAIRKGKQINLDKYVDKGTVKADFKAALEKAEALIGNAETQEEIDAALRQLLNTMNALRLKANKENLQGLYDEYQKLDEQEYTEASWKAFITVMNSVREVLADPNMSEDDQDTIDDLYEELLKVRLQLVKVSEPQTDDTENTDQSESPGSSEEPDDSDTSDLSDTSDTSDSSDGNDKSGKGGKKDNSPKTGDALSYFALIIALLSVMVITLVIKKRKSVN